MSTLAIALKDEIRRLARKEIKAQTGSTAKAVAQCRREIAGLKRQTRELEKKVKTLGSQDHSANGRAVRADVTEGGNSVLRPLSKVAAAANRPIRRRLCSARRSVSTHNLQLGARQVPTQAAAIRLACVATRDWQARSAAEARVARL